jgi:hypothetical protein
LIEVIIIRLGMGCVGGNQKQEKDKEPSKAPPSLHPQRQRTLSVDMDYFDLTTFSKLMSKKSDRPSRNPNYLQHQASVKEAVEDTFTQASLGMTLCDEATNEVTASGLP